MKKIITALCLSGLLSYQVTAVAQTLGYTGKGKVTAVTLGGNGDIFVSTDADGTFATTVDSIRCEFNANNVSTSAYVVPKAHVAYSEYYIMLLSAMDSGDDIQLRIDRENCALGNYRSVNLITRSKP